MSRLPSLIAIVMALALIGAAPIPPPAPEIRYALSPVFEGRALRAIAVELSFAGDADGETLLALPNDWGGNPGLWKHIQAIAVEGGVPRLAGPARRIVRHPPGAPLTVRYRLVNGYDGDPGPAAGNPYRPVIRPTWFQLIGDSTFITPEGRQGLPANVRWTGWPKAWRHASDLDHGEAGQALSLRDIVDSISVGGPGMTVHERAIEGGRLRFAVLGDWDFRTGALADELAAVIGTQRRFWGGEEGPFFVSLTPTAAGDGRRSSGGTGRGDGFAMFSTRNGAGALRYLVAHEHIHSWVPGALGRMPADEREGYWFSEGFSDFYAYRSLLAAGRWSLEDYVARLNADLAAYDASPARGWSNARLAKAYWSDRAAQKLVYRRGMLLALRWDGMVREKTGATKDLDDVMLAMRAQGGAGREIADGFALAMREVAGIDIAADLEALVENGAAFALPRDLPGKCAWITGEVPRRVVLKQGLKGAARAACRTQMAGGI